MKQMPFTVVPSLTILAFALLTVSGVEAVVCGDTLGPGGLFTLTTDLGPCATDAALTVNGPAIVDLGGHTVSCDTGVVGFQIGIKIVGKGAALRNGRVTDCGWGVVVLGGGGHQITKVFSERNAAGFYVGSAHNSLRDNGTVGVPGFSDGFFVQGDSNVLTGNMATGWERGFFVAAGCTFVCGTGSHNSLSRNTATGNTNGFALFSASNNTLTSNQAFGNGTGPACCPEGGIHVDSDSTRNSISGNVALGNVPLGSGASDLSDNTVNCDKNNWTNNVFGTSDQACIH